MPDEIAGAPSPEDTQPAVTNADSTGTPAEDWQARYKELQSTYTRTAQEAAEHRQIVEALTNPETAAEALSALGYELPEPEQPQYEDPYEAQLAELKKQNETFSQQLQQFTQQQQAQQQQAEREAHLLQEQARLEQEHGREFSDVELEALFRLADTAPKEGKPDVQAAYDLLYGKFAEQEFNRRLEAKRNAPLAPAPGQPGAPAPDLSTREGRLAYAMSLTQAQQ